MNIKRKLLAVLCICALLFACTAQAAEINYGYGYVSQVLTYFRKAPSTNAGYYTQLNKGTRVLVTGSDGQFYKVTYNGQNGYIMKTCISDTPVAGANNANANANAWTGNRTGYISEVKVYFRKAPNTMAEYYYQLDKGTKVTVTGQSGLFYQVSYNGISGYVMKTCLSFSAVQTAAQTTTATPATAAAPRTAYLSLDKVYFRTAPSTGASFHCQLSLGTQVTVTGESGMFYAVTYGGMNGYIMKNCITFTRPNATVQPGSIWNTSRIGYISEQLVYFRKAPSTDAGFYTQLAKGTEVTVTGESGNFYKVTYGGVSGYIMKNCLKLSEANNGNNGTDYPVARTGYISQPLTYFRKAASTDAGFYMQLNIGTAVSVTGENGNFYKVSYAGLSGFIMKYCISFTAPLTSAPVLTPVPTTTPIPGGDTLYAVPKTGYVTIDSVYFRMQASITSGFYRLLDKNYIVTVTGENGNFYKVNYGGNSGYVMKTYITFTAPSATAVPGSDTLYTVSRTGYITMDSVYFRLAATTSSGSYGMLNKNTAVTVTGENGNFYKVTYGGNSGYVMKPFVTFTAPSTTAVPGGDTNWATSRTGYVTMNDVYYRTAASTTAGSYGFLAKNTVVTVTGENGNFYKVNYGGRSGYVMKPYITFTAPSVTAVPGGDTNWATSRTGYVTLNDVYFRTAASTTAGSYGFLAKNTAVTVTGENGNFYKVNYGGRSGYVMKPYITFTAPSVTAVPGGDTNWATSRTGYVTLNDVYFRTAASTTAGSYGFLAKNTAVTVTGENGNFYKVTYGGHSGYVMKTYITFTAPSTTAVPGGDTNWSTSRTGYVTLNDVYFRTAASTAAGSYGFLAKNTAVTVTGENGNFYKVTYGGRSGYVMKTYITFTAPSTTAVPGGDTNWSTPQTGYVIMNDVYFRTAPSTSSGSYGMLSKGTAVTVTGENGNFYKVTYNGRSGYVMKTMISSTKPADTTPGSNWTTSKTGYITMNETNFRTAPSTSSGIYRQLNKNTVVTVTGESGDFYKVTYNGVSGYVMRSYVTFTNPNNPYSGTSTTERLDWFNGGKNIFQRGDTFQMKDCYTGRIINCYIQSAGNHLDAEPLTASDTSALLSVYGGSWSYVRRPVLVKYNGHVYAGSLYCEPHGDQVITNNNFDGQFCVHFTGSKTHGTSVVDADHQSAISTAMGYTW